MCSLDFIFEQLLIKDGNGVCRAPKAFGVNCQKANDSYRTEMWPVESHENDFLEPELSELENPVRLMRQRKVHWLNRTVLGIGLASLFSDLSHEMATTIMPAFLATMGVAAAWLGIIEGVSDGLSSFAKMASGYYTDHLRRRKPIAVVGYYADRTRCRRFRLGHCGLACSAFRATAWFGRGLRTPVRKALLAAAVDRAAYGRAFGFERMMDTLGAIIAPALVWILLARFITDYAHLFALTLIPGVAGDFSDRVFGEGKRARASPAHFVWVALACATRRYRRFLVAVGLFGAGAFAHTHVHLAGHAKTDADLLAPRAQPVSRSRSISCTMFSTRPLLSSAAGLRIA